MTYTASPLYRRCRPQAPAKQVFVVAAEARRPNRQRRRRAEVSSVLREKQLPVSHSSNTGPLQPAAHLAGLPGCTSGTCG